MFAKVAGFELRYQLRQPVFWVTAGIFFLLTFGSATIDQIQIGSGGGIHKNAAFAIAQTHLVLSVFYMFVTAAFVANVIVRDDETGYGPLIRATPLRKADYLYGRFTGAFVAAALCFLAVPLAMMVGSLMPWVDRETLGPFDPKAYLFAYVVLALPSLLLTGALFFLLTTVTRSMMLTYAGVIAFMVAYLVSNIVLSKPEFERGAALWEPFGAGAYGLATKYWTASERNALTPPLTGFILANRAIVLGLAAALLALAYPLFRFQSGRPAKASRKAARLAKAQAAAGPPAAIPPVTRFGPGASLAQLIARTRLDMAQVFKSPAYAVLLTLGLLNSVAGVWFATDVSLYDGAIYPVTRVMIGTLTGAFSLIPLIVAVYYAGELVWRERERKTHEIIDASPTPDWAYVVPKTLAIALVLVSTLAVSVVAGMTVQALKGWFHFELGQYLLWYLLPLSVDMLFLAALAVFFQVIAPHKFVGWGLMVLYLVATITLGNLGFDHMLYLHDPIGAIPLSDMNGQGKLWLAPWWGRLYWSAIGLMMLVVAYGAWRRGTEQRLRPRLARLPRRLRGTAGALFGLSFVVFAASGAFIYVNTNVWNEHRTRVSNERWLADSEKTLLRFETLPQPSPVATTLAVDLYPTIPAQR